MKKRAIVSVINDLVTDQRVHKHCVSLMRHGYDVLLIGRRHKESMALDKRDYVTHRMRLPFDKGPLFYLSFTVGLFFQLLFRRSDVYFSNDLDTLLPNVLISKLKGRPLIYDSHEYFTEVPELVHRPKVRAVWERLERVLLPKVKYAFTVSNAIAEAYRTKYGVSFQVIRNLPMLADDTAAIEPQQPPVILYQGSVNLGRGIDLAIRAMQYLDSAVLHIIGTGDVLHEMKDLVKDLDINDRVIFWGRVPFSQLSDMTQKATIGISLEESMGLNYTYALPNKLFDYIHAGVPVLVSYLPEMSQLVQENHVGEVLRSREPKEVAAQIETMMDKEKQSQWRNNCRITAHKLCWQQEVKVLDETLKTI